MIMTVIEISLIITVNMIIMITTTIMIIMIMINHDNYHHNDHQDNHNNNDNDQAANPTTVNVPLCLDLTLNWLLNVYDWSAFNNDDATFLSCIDMMNVDQLLKVTNSKDLLEDTKVTD